MQKLVSILKSKSRYRKLSKRKIPTRNIQGKIMQDFTQKVTRRGIKVNGKEYWNDDLILKYYGQVVKVIIFPEKIRVEDMNMKEIITFPDI